MPLETDICICAAELRSSGVDEFHGYELAKQLAESANRRSLAAYGTLYRALGRLEDMGMLSSRWENPALARRDNRPPRRLYSLTKSGRAAAREAIAERKTLRAGRTRKGLAPAPFRDPFLVRAAEAGYRSAIHPGDRPSLLLSIELQPQDVDVNVHPAKLEVRFRDRIGLERTVEEAVRHALGAFDAAASVGAPTAGRLPPWPAPVAGAPADVADLFTPLGQPSAAYGEQGTTEPLGTFAAPLFSLFDTYIAFESEDTFVIVDQHSAHERVLFEDVMQELTGTGATAQRLLVPATVELTDEELDAVQGHQEALSRVGYEVGAFGGRTVLLHAVPALHARFDAVACFRELVADLARGRFGGWANRLERFAASFACRAAVKAGDKLDEREMRELLVRLFASTLPPHDVHGRATIVQLSREELERRFGRR